MLQQKDIRKVLLAGAGVMGSSFAQIFAKHGYEVILYDIAERSLEKARGVISVNQEAEVASGELTAEESAALVERITMTTSKEYFSQADFVLESTVENMELRHAFWREASELVRPEIVICTNTSGMSITEIAKAVKNPARFTGMHWVNLKKRCRSYTMWRSAWSRSPSGCIRTPPASSSTVCSMPSSARRATVSRKDMPVWRTWIMS